MTAEAAAGGRRAWPTQLVIVIVILIFEGFFALAFGLGEALDPSRTATIGVGQDWWEIGVPPFAPLVLMVVGATDLIAATFAIVQRRWLLAVLATSATVVFGVVIGLAVARWSWFVAHALVLAAVATSRRGFYN